MLTAGTPYIHYTDTALLLHVAGIDVCDGTAYDIPIAPVEITPNAMYHGYLVIHNRKLYVLGIYNEANGVFVEINDITGDKPVTIIFTKIDCGNTTTSLIHNSTERAVRVKTITKVLETDDKGRIGFVYRYRKWQGDTVCMIIWIYVDIVAVSVEKADNAAVSAVKFTSETDYIYVMQYDRISNHNYIIAVAPNTSESNHITMHKLTLSVTCINVHIQHESVLPAIFNISALSFVVWGRIFAMHHVNQQSGFEIEFNMTTGNARWHSMNSRRTAMHFAYINDASRFRGGYSRTDAGVLMYHIICTNFIDNSTCMIYVNIDQHITDHQFIMGLFTCV